MRNRVLLFASCASLLAAVSLRASADEGAKHDLSRRDRWQAGDVRTTTSSQKQSQKTLVKGSDGTVIQDVEKKTEVRHVTVQKVLEADAEGRITKSRVHLKEWSRTEDAAEPDASLKGALLEVTGRGNERKWKLLSPDAGVSEGAQEWLASTYGAKPDSDEAAQKAILPKGPVAVGETWAGDVAPLADALSEHLPVDREKAKIDVKLASVEGGVATIAVTAKLPLTGLPGGPGGATMPFTEGGAFDLTLEVKRPLEGRIAGSEDHAQQSLTGKADAGGAEVTLDVTIESEEKTTIGGEVPEPPAPAPPPVK